MIPILGSETGHRSVPLGRYLQNRWGLILPLLACSLGWTCDWAFGFRHVDTAAHRERVIRAIRIPGPIVVDGLLDEPEWRLAEPAGDFTQRIPQTGQQATERTEVRLLYDDEQINLTRFSLFFPEKREFFIENARIFELGRRPRRQDLLPFFSRRIGLTDDGNLVPILGGGRLTGRVGPYSVGLLSMWTGETAQTPANSFTVARLRRDILRKSDVGGILINKHAFGSEDHRTFGADGNFNFHRYLDLSAYLVKTDSPGKVGRNTAGNLQVGWVDGFYEVQGAHLRVGFWNSCARPVSSVSKSPSGFARDG